MQIGLILVVLYIVANFNYLLFHVLAEFFGSAISLAIFLLTWNARKFVKNNYYLFFGMAFLTSGMISLIHALTYRGMGVVAGTLNDSNVATQLWLANQYIMATTFLIAPFLLEKKIRSQTIVWAYLTAFALFLTMIFYWKIFPVAYAEGSGLTPFKKVSEYIVATAYIFSLYFFWRRRDRLEKRVLHLITFTLALFFVSTITFAFYVGVYSFPNELGHLLRVLAFYVSYLALVEFGLMRPYHSMFRELNENKKVLQDAKNGWERTFNSVPDLIAILDENHGIVRANKAMAERLGTTAEACIGMKCYQAVHKCDRPIELCPHAQSLLDGKEHISEVHEPNLGGDFLVSTTPLKNGEGQLLGSVHVARDITERKKVEMALKESEEGLKRSQAIAHLGNWELDISQNKLTWSDEVYRIFGLKPQEFGATYEAFLKAIHPDDRKIVDEAYSNSIRDGRDTYAIEHRVLRPSGEIRYVQEKCEHFRDESGKIIRSAGMVHDITVRKMAEKKIADLAKFPLENPNPVMRISSEGKIIYANPASTIILDKFEIGKGDSVPKEWEKAVKEAISEISKKIIEVDAGDKKFLITIAPVAKDSYVNVYSAEITKLKNAEAALYHEKEKLKQILNKMEDGVYIVNREYNISYINPALKKYFGQNIERQKCFEYLHGRKSPCPWCVNKEVFSGKSVRWECFFENLNRTFDIIETPMTAPEGTPVKLQILRDITEKKMLEKNKEDFISLASHQLRTPLSSIALSSELLLRGTAGKTEPAQKEYLEEINKTTKRMALLVNNLLNVSRLEMGTFSVETEPLDILSVIQTKLKEFEPIILEKKLKIEKKIQENIPGTFFNANSFEIVFDNLLSNAIRYTPAGGEISIELRKEKGAVLLEVRDTGCGIPEKQKGKIFEKTFRAENAKEMSSEGAGLGLYMVKSIADLTGSKVWFDSAEEKGTTFYFSIPLN
ncbi:MAG: hypothetical protein A2420_03100 [Candidatus Moranbacteria bacterium RIFOXYC1_FULL_44_13]|nr:MAG: hypothetical protein A2420_03100 [Candidatus Moranbacteria bacterium RIFOXYC1_FULL_44_13]OGI38157.1 MAG: hypothetical protein A2612_01390 [Candidatus Moranbacteria bacterium RIFOXYD1_FULL_44_12]